MTKTSTAPRTFAELLELDPGLSVLVEFLDAHRGEADWEIYGKAKDILCGRIGFFAPADARPELTTSGAYEIGLAHIVDELGI